MENGDIENPQTWGIKPTLINLPMDLHKEAKDEGIVFREALEFGIKFLIADKDGFDYPDCKLQDKLEKTVAHRNSLLHENSMLREAEEVEDEKDVKDVKVDKEEIEKEMDDVFGRIV